MSFFKKLFGLADAPQPAQQSAAPAAKPAPQTVSADVSSSAEAIVAALGGVANIQSVQACAATRLRIQLADSSSVDEAAVRAAGANGLMPLANNLVHVLVGLEADSYALAVERLRA